MQLTSFSYGAPQGQTLSMTQMILHHSCPSISSASSDDSTLGQLEEEPVPAKSAADDVLQIKSRSHADESHIDVEHWTIHTAKAIGQEVSSWTLRAPDSGGPADFSSYRAHAKDLGAYLIPSYNDEEACNELVSRVEDEAEDEVRNNDTLRQLRRNSRNLVLDSICPEVAPHIVISPPDNQWTDMTVGQENAAPIQSTECLMVSAVPSSVLASVSEPAYENILESYQDRLRCFSLSRFVRNIESTRTERQTFSHLLPPINKRLYRNCAWLASVEAAKYQDSPVYHPQAEPEWIDPAIPLLLEARKYFGTLIIDSTTPSITPHIIINEPPVFENDPWIKMFNSTQNPQDSAYGKCLTVPSPLVDVINCKPVDFFAITFGDGSTTSASSAASTPPMLTPIVEVDEPIPGVIYSSYPASSFVNDGGEQDREEETHAFYAEEDEDEDDLPPLDDWYKDIATRTGVTL